MKIIFAVIIFLLSRLLTAQDPVVVTTFNNTFVSNKDSIVVISTIGDPLAGVTQQNDIIVTSQPIPFLFLAEQQTSVKDLPLIEGLNVYPNPVSEIMVIQRNSYDESLYVKLFSENGMVLFEKMWETGENMLQIPFGSIPAGNYFLTLIDGKETKAGRFKVVKL